MTIGRDIDNNSGKIGFSFINVSFNYLYSFYQKFKSNARETWCVILVSES